MVSNINYEQKILTLNNCLYYYSFTKGKALIVNLDKNSVAAEDVRHIILYLLLDFHANIKLNLYYNSKRY